MTGEASTLAVRDPVVLDDRIRGVPPGTAHLDARDLAGLGWHPADGGMALPVLTLDEAAFLHNRDLFLAYLAERGVSWAPHAKTPMAPDIARALVAAGAWGTTVADARQATVMMRAGLTRLILANEAGGTGGAKRLAAMIAAFPAMELFVFVDSRAAVDALGQAWRDAPALPPLNVLVELGAGRAGARTPEQAEAAMDAIEAADGRLTLAGVAAYEGAAALPDPDQTDASISALLDLTACTLGAVRARAVSRRLIVTAGGSAYFDKVIDVLAPAVAADGNATLVLRSGALLFNDHGVYDRGLAALDRRGGYAPGGERASARAAFRPALRLWAEVLSRPEPGLAICGMGMRDVSFDQGFPAPLQVWRGGGRAFAPESTEVIKLNDQHAFLNLPQDSALAVGDVVEFGISHPCTCLDRYRVIFGVDAEGRVVHAFPTHFG